MRLTRAHNPDLVLMDIHMPVMDGLEATRRLRELPEFADLPIIALTASVGVESVERCMEAGCTRHLAKPLQTQELFSALAEFGGSKRSEI